jgi:hypothetical protein
MLAAPTFLATRTFNSKQLAPVSAGDGRFKNELSSNGFSARICRELGIIERPCVQDGICISWVSQPLTDHASSIQWPFPNRTEFQNLPSQIFKLSRKRYTV